MGEPVPRVQESTSLPILTNVHRDRSLLPDSSNDVADALNRTGDEQDENVAKEGLSAPWATLIDIVHFVPSEPGVYELKVGAAKKSACIRACNNLREVLTLHSLKKKSGHKLLDQFVSRNLTTLLLFQLGRSSTTAPRHPLPIPPISCPVWDTTSKWMRSHRASKALLPRLVALQTLSCSRFVLVDYGRWNSDQSRRFHGGWLVQVLNSFWRGRAVAGDGR
ncbi:hypothetical protein AVEN_171493-1 [Araneus ventricosus]|uniref:Uncharacterized protein n=1 Tax=Araneus ventricosus TaxID=182803 RepID=A0A4Y2HB28_ARAVE|nr:hypothetical protein AVEN_171493-1 [Araneus ventricosus]